MILLHVFVTDFVAVISSQSEGLGKMALGIVKIYLGLPFPANRRCSWSVCSRSVCLRSVGSRSVVAVSCRGPIRIVIRVGRASGSGNETDLGSRHGSGSGNY